MYYFIFYFFVPKINVVVVVKNVTGLKMPTGRRQTSWLFTNVTEKLN